MGCGSSDYVRNYFDVQNCAYLCNFMRNFYLLTKQNTTDAKIAHSLEEICAIFCFYVQNRALRGPNPITVGHIKVSKYEIIHWSPSVQFILYKHQVRVYKKNMHLV